jgi:hypothetical protein
VKKHLVTSLLLVATGFLAVGCGSGSSSAMKHITNTDYNFAIDYPASLGQIPFPQASSTAFAFTFVVGDKTIRPDIYNAVGNMLALGSWIEPQSDRPQLVGLAWLGKQAATAKNLDSFHLIAKGQSTLGGFPAFEYEGVGSSQGKEMYFKNLLVVTPRYTYGLIVQAFEADWNGNLGRQLQEAISSFHLLSGTPSTAASVPPHTTYVTYKNTAYHFSLTYPSDYSQIGQKDIPSATAADFAVGFFDTSQSAVNSNTGLLDGVQVQVMKLPRAVTPGQAELVLQKSVGPMRDQVVAGYQGLYQDVTAGRFQTTHLNGLPSVTFVISYTTNGEPVRSEVWFVLAGRFQYQIELDSTPTEWNAHKAAFERIARSFGVL